MDILVERLRDEAGLNGGSGAYAWRARELCSKAADELTRLTAEVEEQARLNGMGAERELALLAKVERLTAENARLRGLIEPTEANVERVAKKMCCPGTSCVGVDDGDGCRAEYWFEDATAALNALDPET